MRRVGEIANVALTLLVPAVLIVSFPREGLAKAVKRGKAPAKFTSLVTLTPEAEDAALLKARTSWKVGERAVRLIDLMDEPLPIVDRAGFLPFDPKAVKIGKVAPYAFHAALMPESVAAPKGAVLPPAPVEEKAKTFELRVPLPF